MLGFGGEGQVLSGSGPVRVRSCRIRRKEKKKKEREGKGGVEKMEKERIGRVKDSVGGKKKRGV